jgi:hypothetical protein
MILQINSIGIPATNNDNDTISQFSENILLSITDSPYAHHVEATLAISGDGTLFAGWKESMEHNGAGIRVGFTKSVDNGLTWSAPFNMPNFEANTGQSDPWLVWYEETETLYYTYLEYSLSVPIGEGFTQMTVAKSIDYGETWNLVTASYGDGFADKETMTVSNDGTLYVVYDDIDVTSGSKFVRLTRSDDGGSTFKEISVVADSITNPEDHLGPYITTDSNNNVYVAWFWFTDGSWGDIYVTSSEDKGLTFTTPVDINQDGENCTFETSTDQRPAKGSLPVIEFDQNNGLYALWSEKLEPDGLWDVYLRYSDDYGLTWSNRYLINPSTIGNQWEPDMEIDSQGRIHVVYYDDEGGSSFKPFYRVLEFPQSGEPIFGNPIDISNGISTPNTFTRPGEYFSIRVDSNNVPHVVWSDGRNNEMDIYYAHGLSSTDTDTTTTTESTPIGLGIFAPIALVLLISYRRRNRD